MDVGVLPTVQAGSIHKAGNHMYCAKCGAFIDDGQRFCSECGEPVERPDGALGNEATRLIDDDLDFGMTAVGEVPLTMQSTPTDLGSTGTRYVSSGGTGSYTDGTRVSPSPLPSLDSRQKSFGGSVLKGIAIAALVCVLGILLAFVILPGTDSGNEPSNSEEPYHENSGLSSKADAENQGTEASPAVSFPREWTGTLDGMDVNGNSTLGSIQMTFTQVTDDGQLSGLCMIGPDPAHPEVHAGSYYIEGHVNWSTGSIKLWWTAWADQGSLENRRQYSGQLDSSNQTITGTVENLSGNYPGHWSMSAD